MTKSGEGETTLPKGLDRKYYEIDASDGLPRELVGSWAKHKYALLRRYVDISGIGVRRRWLKRGDAGATYIDLFSGPGRVRVRDTPEVLDGSPMVAWRQAVASKAVFTEMHVADASPDLVAAADRRLRTEGALVQALSGVAAETIDLILPRLNPYALHFAFLDPYSLGVLPFEVVRKLASLDRMDILIHVSSQDISRNLRRYIAAQDSPLDSFAPGWRAHVGDVARPDHYVRSRILEHWRNLLRTVGMSTAEVAELVTADGNQPLYWLAFVARHPRAIEFWEKIRSVEPDPQGRLTW